MELKSAYRVTDTPVLVATRILMLMDMFDFEEPFHPDLFSKERWAGIPEPIRKQVEQHVLAHLSGDMLAQLRDLHCPRNPDCSDERLR